MIKKQNQYWDKVLTSVLYNTNHENVIMKKEEIDISKVTEMEFEGYTKNRAGIVSHDELNDVFCVKAMYGDRDMTDDELEILNDDNSDFVWEAAYDELCT